MINDYFLVLKELKNKFPKLKCVFPYDSSYNVIGEVSLFVANIDQGDMLIAYGKEKPVFNELSGVQNDEFKFCPLSHANRLVVNKYLPFTAPIALGSSTASFGFGDRLGLANYAHLNILNRYNLKPVLAQQSARELSLTNRTYDDVLDAAAWSVFKYGWRGGYAADGDHLKYEKDIAMALDCGYTMITLDCSDKFVDIPEDKTALMAAYNNIPQLLRARFESDYLYNSEAESLGVKYDMHTLIRTAVTYYAAIEFSKKIYKEHIIKAGRPIDFELSLDETGQVTSVEAHYFVANELKKSKVNITSLAPHFVGEFQKGIDYIGDIDQFRYNLRDHDRIAKHFGYRLSIHSGSDKFSIFPYIRIETDGHLLESACT
jgi:hypothetical protein